MTTNPENGGPIGEAGSSSDADRSARREFLKRAAKAAAAAPAVALLLSSESKPANATHKWNHWS